MKKTLVIFIILSCFLVQGQQIKRLGNSIKPNIVKIKTFFSDNSTELGFGFIILEEDKELYIVTAKHVVESIYENVNTKEIKTFLYGIEDVCIANVVITKDKYDLALIKVTKPEGFDWAYTYRTSNCNTNKKDKIWIIGKDWSWSSPIEENPGYIYNIKAPWIKAEYPGLQIGVSGGPVINRSGVIGMLISDQGSFISILSIKTIVDWVNQYLKLDNVDLNDYPYYTFNGGIGIYLSNKRDVGAFKSDQNRFNLGAEIETMFSSRKAISIDYVFCDFTDGATEYEDLKYNFQNTTHTLSLNYKFYQDLSGIVMGENAYYLLGISLISHDPKLNDGSGWRRISEISEFEYQYSDKILGIKGGAGYVLNYGHLSVGFKVDVLITLCRNLDIKLSQVYGYQDVTVLWNFGFTMGYIKRNKKSERKVIRHSDFIY